MKTFAINTLGCKVNQYESQQIRELLESLGLKQVDNNCKRTDLVVINTCCVTHTASAKSRQYLRKALRANPNCSIVVVGCLPAVDIGELDEQNNNNVLLVKNHNNLAATLHQIINSVQTLEAKSVPLILHKSIRPKNAREIKDKKQLEGPKKLPGLTAFDGQTRAFLKVQDGCDGRCAYCIVPKTRPNLSSKPIETVLQEAQDLVNAGHREIVVTGIYLGAYGLDTARRRKWKDKQNPKLAELLEKLVKISGLERIRLSSLEPGDVTEQLLDVLEANRNIMPHLHLSLQSGSSATLKRMCRQYTAEFFRDTVDMIKKRLDRPAITTDIIVGFPGETDEDFEQNVELAKCVCFEKMHVFPFSARRGTAAAKMQPVVNNGVIKERAKVLRDLDVQLATEFREQFVGETVTILLENAGSYSSGRSERYFMVRVKKSPKSVRKNDLLTVRLTGNASTYAVGEIVA
jgi:threonylcarbamoyladenosine tRNA methylthiotransferase MtaB